MADRYVYCSRKCKKEASNVKFTCENCNKTIVLKRFQLKSHGYERKYCSRKCWDEVMKTNNPSFREEVKEKLRGRDVWNDGLTKETDPRVKEMYIGRKNVRLFGKDNPMYGKVGEQNPFFGKKHSKETITIMSEKAIKRIQGQKVFANSKSGFREDLNCWFRSSWEANVARYFNLNRIDWVYEKQYLSLASGKKYLPDFYLPKENKFIEVKGFFSDEAKEKIKEASTSHNIEVISRDKYFQIEKEFSSKIKNWEN